MTRDLSPALAAAIVETHVATALMAEFDFDSQTIGLWSGVGLLQWNGVDYLGGGTLINVSPVTETQDLQAAGLVFELSGIPSNLLAIALEERYQGRPCRLYLGTVSSSIFKMIKEADEGGGDLLLESGGAILTEDGGHITIEADDPGAILMEDGSYVLLENSIDTDDLSPYRVFSGLMDVMEFSDDGQTASIRLSAENMLTLLTRSKERRYTDEDQKARYPGDRGFEFIAQLQDKQITW